MDTEDRKEHARREFDWMTETMGELAMRAARLASGGFVVLKQISAAPEDSDDDHAVVQLLSGKVPPECLREFEELARRWGQDLHVGYRNMTSEIRGEEAGDE